jgi:hypothetical protein
MTILPTGSVVFMVFKVTWRTHIACLEVSLIFALLMNNPVNSILQDFINSISPYYPVENIVINFYICISVLLLIISVVHEGIHAIMYILFSGKVRFGFKFIYAYTHEISSIALERIKFLIILLAPLVMISLTSVVLGHIGGMVYLINLLGSSGDILMSLILCRYHPGCKIIDRSYGFEVIYAENQQKSLLM